MDIEEIARSIEEIKENVNEILEILHVNYGISPSERIRQANEEKVEL